MVLCAVSLGGNVGDVPQAFADAVQMLQSSAGVSGVRRSRIYRTAPMGAHAGAEFLNAATVFDTTLAPLDVLDLLREIENRCGRVRTIRWGPRTLDLDLLLYGDRIIELPRLLVPHPALWYRRFVLDPLVELIPDAVHPVFQQTIRELRNRLLVRPLPVCLADDSMDSFRWVEAARDVDHSYPVVSISDVDWLSSEDMGSAAIIFAAPYIDVHQPRLIRLPDAVEDSVQFIMDVLTAALDEPVPVS